MKKRYIELTGQRFGRLSVLQLHPEKWRGNMQWLCLCDCGTEKIVPGSRLRYGQTTSCGCRRHEPQNIKHGLSKHPLYQVWHGMKNRCLKPNDAHYARYGGRGIIICDRWLDVANFIADNEASYKPGLFLDRIDNNGPYSPDNCQWSDAETQANNKSNNRLITFQGRTQTLLRWARETGLHYRTINSRMDLLKWSVEDALTKPTRKKG